MTHLCVCVCMCVCVCLSVCLCVCVSVCLCVQSVGAAAVLASVFRAPVTGILLMFELTRNYDIALPLIATVQDNQSAIA